MRKASAVPEAPPAVFARLAQRLRRADALARLAERGESGGFDELLDKTAYRR